MLTDTQIQALATMRIEDDWVRRLVAELSKVLDVSASSEYLYGLLDGLLVARGFLTTFSTNQKPDATIDKALFAAVVATARACREAKLFDGMARREGSVC